MLAGICEKRGLSLPDIKVYLVGNEQVRTWPNPPFLTPFLILIPTPFLSPLSYDLNPIPFLIPWTNPNFNPILCPHPLPDSGPSSTQPLPSSPTPNQPSINSSLILRYLLLTSPKSHPTPPPLCFPALPIFLPVIPSGRQSRRTAAGAGPSHPQPLYSKLRLPIPEMTIWGSPHLLSHQEHPTAPNLGKTFP